MNNTKFRLAASITALLLTFLFLTYTRSKIISIKKIQSRIERRLDSMNLANKSFRQKKDSIKQTSIRRRDSIVFNYQSPIIDHSEIKGYEK